MTSEPVTALAARVDAALVLGDSGSSPSSRMDALERRQRDIAARLARLEALAGAAAALQVAALPAISDPDPGAGAVQLRLQAELLERGIPSHRFVRAPPEYYARPLEFRRAVLGAASVQHLCKSIIMENTRVAGDEPGVTKYWLVVVQYSAKLHSDKLRAFVHAAHGGALPKRWAAAAPL